VPLPPAGAIDALLLDLDDTILDDSASRAPAWEAAVALIHAANPALQPASLLEAIAAEASWFWSDPGRHRSGRLDLYAARLEILERALSRLGQREPELARRAIDGYFEVRERGYRLAPGAAEALSRLREAMPRLALVTNGASEPQRAKVERF